LGINNIELSFEENLEVVEKDQVLQEVDKLKSEKEKFWVMRIVEYKFK
jgi:hypothetical protein